jgi:hypothetical protein
MDMCRISCRFRDQNVKFIGTKTKRKKVTGTKKTWSRTSLVMTFIPDLGFSYIQQLIVEF